MDEADKIAAELTEQGIREGWLREGEHFVFELTDVIPETTRLRPRPLYRRIMRRYDCEEFGVPLPPPDDAEVQDAIRVLEEGPMPGPLPDPVWHEAHRIMEDYGS